jgi:hypothetical protein
MGCGMKPVPQVPHQALVAQLESETVALIRLVDADGDDDDNGHPKAYCAGVFIAPTVIVTAEHCVNFLGLTPLQKLARELDIDDGKPSAIGWTARYQTQDTVGDRYFRGTVIADERETELAAIRIDPSNPYGHAAKIGLGEIEDGDRVEFVGHPLGYLWSYGEGIVSSTHADKRNPTGNVLSVVQVMGAMTYGNSGGPLFDSYGRVIGIASYLDKRYPGVGFFIHRDNLLTLVHKIAEGR